MLPCHSLGQPEIDQFDLAILAIHDVLWLDVAMYHPRGMTVVNRAKEFLHNLGRLTLTEHLVLLRRNLVEELAARAVLHDKVHVLDIIIGLVILDDVRMVQLRQNSDLLFDGLDVVFQPCLIQNLYSNLERWV